MTRPSLSYWSDAWRRFQGQSVAMVSAVILLLIILMTIFQPIFSPYEYDQIDYFALNRAPACHLFGTDDLGRDIFTRCWMGARVSLTIAFVVAVSRHHRHSLRRHRRVLRRPGGQPDDALLRAHRLHPRCCGWCF